MPAIDPMQPARSLWCDASTGTRPFDFYGMGHLMNAQSAGQVETFDPRFKFCFEGMAETGGPGVHGGHL
jgi:hypothetical protein